MRALLASLSVLLAAAAGAAPARETFGEITVDWSTVAVIVAGAAAADPHAPNASVARVRAERGARLIAARRFVTAAAKLPWPRLGCRGPQPARETIETAALRAPAESIEWSSDGSVSLVLRIAAAELCAPAPDGGRADAGAAGR